MKVNCHQLTNSKQAQGQQHTSEANIHSLEVRIVFMKNEKEGSSVNESDTVASTRLGDNKTLNELRNQGDIINKQCHCLHVPASPHHV